MENKLLPCPFCPDGGEVVFKDGWQRDDGLWINGFVRCNECRTVRWSKDISDFLGKWRHGFVSDEVAHECSLTAIEAWNTRHINGETSDGYHTFNELYHHRAVLFSKVVQAFKDKAWKAKKHSDGSMFDGGWFIVGVDTPEGQATYHYEIEPYWDMFDCEEVEYAPVWDGHTPDQAIERIGKLNTRHERTCQIEGTYSDEFAIYDHLTCGHVNLRHWHEPTSYCSTCGARVKEDADANN